MVNSLKSCHLQCFFGEGLTFYPIRLNLLPRKVKGFTPKGITFVPHFRRTNTSDANYLFGRSELFVLQTSLFCPFCPCFCLKQLHFSLFPKHFEILPVSKNRQNSPFVNPFCRFAYNLNFLFSSSERRGFSIAAGF